MATRQTYRVVVGLGDDGTGGHSALAAGSMSATSPIYAAHKMLESIVNMPIVGNALMQAAGQYVTIMVEPAHEPEPRADYLRK